MSEEQKGKKLLGGALCKSTFPVELEKTRDVSSDLCLELIVAWKLSIVQEGWEVGEGTCAAAVSTAASARLEGFLD